MGVSDKSAPGLPTLLRALFTLLPAAGLAASLALLLSTAGPRTFSVDWVPSLGLPLTFAVDGLSGLFLLMITGVGTAVFIYAGGYMAGDPGELRLHILLSLFLVAMVGCVTADHLLILFLFWEATSFLSFLLVGFHHDAEKSRKSAQQALLITGAGGLALLAGSLLLMQVAGTGRISELVRIVPTLGPSGELQAALILILVGAFTKSAQFPFHFWLPNAMAAPTPVSAYLHSATMVKLGVYLLARLDPAFGHSEVWQLALKIAGSITAAWGMVLALKERDLKRILAWSTVATLGTLVMLVGLQGDGATVAVSALLLAHALYKAPLFFVAGNIDHGTGTRIIDQLGNLRHAMPWTAAAALLAGASMAGMPLSFGYIVKDVIATAKGEADIALFAKAANIVFGAIAVAVAGVAAIRVFWRHPGVNLTCEAHEGGWRLTLPPLLLATLGLVLGLSPTLVQELIARASGAMTVSGESALFQLRPEFGPTLVSLGVTLAIGALVFIGWDPLHRLLDGASKKLGHEGMLTLYEQSVKAVPKIAARSTRLLQTGVLPHYLGLAALVSSALLALALWHGGAEIHWPTAFDAPLGVVGSVGLIAAGSVLACFLRGRLVLLLTAGLVGFGSAVLFLFIGAADVGLTQFTVETVFVIVAASVLLAIKRNGRPTCLPERRVRPWSLAIALSFATALVLVLTASVGVPFNAELSNWFGAHSVPDAHGRNVVNVIIVDFRGLDTLGEITVVLLAFLAVLPIIQALRQRPAEDRR